MFVEELDVCCIAAGCCCCRCSCIMCTSQRHDSQPSTPGSNLSCVYRKMMVNEVYTSKNYGALTAHLQCSTSTKIPLRAEFGCCCCCWAQSLPSSRHQHHHYTSLSFALLSKHYLIVIMWFWNDIFNTLLARAHLFVTHTNVCMQINVFLVCIRTVQYTPNIWTFFPLFSICLRSVSNAYSDSKEWGRELEWVSEVQYNFAPAFNSFSTSKQI